MVQFTKEQFTAAMEAAVALKGEDYVYPSHEAGYADPDTGTCLYSTPEGAPACIIGVALSLLDPELVPDSFVVEGAHSVLESLVPEDVSWAADVAQSEQDAGHTWGEALEAYEIYLANTEGD